MALQACIISDYYIIPFNKGVMFNAAFDVLDALGFQIEKANSERGRHEVSSDKNLLNEILPTPEFSMKTNFT